MNQSNQIYSPILSNQQLRQPAAVESLLFEQAVATPWVD